MARSHRRRPPEGLARDRVARQVIPADHPDISDVYVQEEYRGAGFGTALLLEAERRVAGRGHRHVGLSVNPAENGDARRLYERFGYRHDGGEPYLDGVYDGVEDWVIDLVKELP